MKHLTDEQIEQLAGGGPEPGHLAECSSCRDRLAQRRAVRDRLQSAFASVKAGPGLLEQIRRQVDAESGRGGEGKVSAESRGGRSRLLVFRFWPAMTAAAMLIVVVSVVLHLSAPIPASAAPAELVRIHEHSTSEERDIFTSAEPAKLAEFLKGKLGFAPAMPELGHGMELRGCCVVHFHGRPVGSYVVDTPRGVISIVVVDESPDSLGMTGRSVTRAGRTYRTGSFARCEMAVVRLGQYSYCAVGEVEVDLLVDLLERLVPAKQ